MLYNELEQGDILSGVRWRLALLAYTDILLCSIWAMRRIRQTPVPYFCLVGCDTGRRARRHESWFVLAPLGAHLRSVPAQPGRRFPRACRWGTPRRRRATLRSSPGIWALGHRDPRAGVAPGGPAGRPVACPEL